LRCTVALKLVYSLFSAVSVLQLLQRLAPYGVSLFVLVAAGAQAALVDVYRGTLGGSAVVMELGKPGEDGERQGRYFICGMEWIFRSGAR
jgi:hypothetical protein